MSIVAVLNFSAEETTERNDLQKKVADAQHSLANFDARIKNSLLGLRRKSDTHYMYEYEVTVVGDNQGATLESRLK
jgi:hypothetical protein